MSSTPKICATNVFLALIDLDKPSRAVDVTDYLAGETGADSRRIAFPVRRQLDYLARKGCIEKRTGGAYSVVRDERMIRERLKILESQNTEYLNKPCLEKKPKKMLKMSRYKTTGFLTFQKTERTDTSESCISIAGCMSIAAIPRQIRRENPILRSTMSQAEFEYTQRFWREPLSLRDDDDDNDVGDIDIDGGGDADGDGNGNGNDDEDIDMDIEQDQNVEILSEQD